MIFIPIGQSLDLRSFSRLGSASWKNFVSNDAKWKKSCERSVPGRWRVCHTHHTHQKWFAAVKEAMIHFGWFGVQSGFFKI
jgi:hypothetical protein